MGGKKTSSKLYGLFEPWTWTSRSGHDPSRLQWPYMSARGQYEVKKKRRDFVQPSFPATRVQFFVLKDEHGRFKVQLRVVLESLRIVYVCPVTSFLLNVSFFHAL